MLVLTRKLGEQILVGEDIVITVLDARGDGVRIGIDAPKGVRIQRGEVVRAVTEANVAATQTDPDAADRIKALLGLSARGSRQTPDSGTDCGENGPKEPGRKPGQEPGPASV